MYFPQELVPSRFQPRQELGAGSFGRTFLALDQESGEPCVIKQLSFAQAESWKSIELFEREARILSQLEHPRIPKFLGFYNQESAHQACLIQQYIPGQTLQAAIESGKRFDESEVITLAEDLLDVLDYLHHFSPPVIHRDIKPSNVILGPEGQAYLVDFGAVTDHLLHQQGGGSTIVGTFGYMPPEQLDGRAVPGSDLYALGASLIYALSGLDPSRMEKENLSLNFRPFVEVSNGFAHWLAKMTHPDYKQRFASAQEAREALFARQQLTSSAPQTQQLGQQAGISSRSRLILFAAAGGFMLAGLAFWGIGQLEQKLNTVSGSLRQALPGAALPEMAPRFWLIDLQTQQRVRPEIDYQQGHFEIKGLNPGHYGLNIAYDLNPANPLQYPGDLRAWSEFDVRLGGPAARLQLELIQLIHLKTPADNNQPIPGWGQPCQQPPAASGLTRFSWDALGADVNYDYQLTQVSCPEEGEVSQLMSVFKGSTRRTSLELKLPANSVGSYYRFSLQARKDGHKIGRLRTHGAEDHDWDYRFRVR